MDEPTKEKLEEIHKDIKGGFQAVHDRADRENAERGYMMQRVVEMWQTVERLIRVLFRKEH